MAVSFLGLSAIPARKITDRGLGLDRFELVPIRGRENPVRYAERWTWTAFATSYAAS